MTPQNSDQDRRRVRGRSKRPVSRRDVLKTGLLAPGPLAVGTAAGSRRSGRGGGNARFQEGNTVLDGDDPDPDPAIVVNTLEVPITDWTVFGSETVADHNPSYDPSEQVVIVAYEDRLEAGWPDWRRTRPDALFDGVVARGIKFHAFPRTRLQRTRNRGCSPR